MPASADPMAVFEQTVAPIASEETRRTITRAESRPQALALLFMSPEFQTAMTMTSSMHPPAVNCCSPPARCSPGPICPSSRSPRAATRACWRSCCAARSTASPRSRRSAIPNWVKLRGDKALTLDGETPALPLDGMFALNPAMPNLHRLYKAGAATIVHAAATPYRERSHFDGQDVLESGLPRPGAVSTGWLNRALATLAPADRANPRARNAFAVGPIAPLVVRGAAPVLSWTPPRLPPAGDDTVMRLLDLYRHTDPALARVLEERMGLAAIARAGGMNQQGAANAQPRGAANAVRAYFEQSAGAAAQIPGARRRPAHRRARLRRLGHPRQ